MKEIKYTTKYNFEKVKNEWDNRAEAMGSTLNSVLFKRFPKIINKFIHNKHKNFILKSIDIDIINLLDVGCGYGRLSAEIKSQHPNAMLKGIDISEKFIESYNRNIGFATCVPLEEFKPSEKYSIVISTTILMYIDPDLLSINLKKIWDSVLPGGWLFIIEPANEFQKIYRILSGNINAKATGGNVRYFSKEELYGYIEKLEEKYAINYKSISIAPGIKYLSLHHMFSIKKCY
jgi:2-polyprenyl-3-methyl-5-hydroxy-6-metoxy-1,4-benzoquinol methylase